MRRAIASFHDFRCCGKARESIGAHPVVHADAAKRASQPVQVAYQWRGTQRLVLLRGQGRMDSAQQVDSAQTRLGRPRARQPFDGRLADQVIAVIGCYGSTDLLAKSDPARKATRRRSRATVTVTPLLVCLSRTWCRGCTPTGRLAGSQLGRNSITVRSFLVMSGDGGGKP